MDQPKLSVAIPVYNGARSIAVTLESIFVQLGDVLEGAVEIVVSDNCSDDQTLEILQLYAENNSTLVRVSRNKENLGYDANVDRVVQFARGEFVWLLGCGEYVLPGAIKRIYSAISNGSYQNLVLNFRIRNEGPNVTTDVNLLQLYQDVLTTNHLDFLSLRPDSYTPLSTNVLQRSRYLAIVDHPLKEVGWVHVERVIHIQEAESYPRSLFICFECFVLQREVDGWWTKGGNLLANTVRLMNIYRRLGFPPYPPRFVRKFLGRFTTLDILRKAFLARRQGATLSPRLFRILMEQKRFSPMFWFAVVPILWAPRQVLSLLWNCREHLKAFDFMFKSPKPRGVK